MGLATTASLLPTRLPIIDSIVSFAVPFFLVFRIPGAQQEVCVLASMPHHLSRDSVV
jgi:hypothetical protein